MEHVVDPETPINPVPSQFGHNLNAVAQLHAEHHHNASPLQRSVDRLTGLLARPRSVAILTWALLAWVSGNLVAGYLGFHPIDPPPFSRLGNAVSVIALYLVVLVLVTQRREDELNQRRERLTLELALLSEQKTTKVIQLLEELRRDIPHVDDRHDAEAEALARPADARSVLDSIRKSDAEAEQNKSRKG